MSSKNLIVVTGFGPFKGHEEVNASWEAVRLLPDELEYAGKVFVIRKLEIPVVYEDVETSVRELFSLDPLLVIHCGVHGRINQINLETKAMNGKFSNADVLNRCLPCPIEPLANNGKSCMVLETKFDVDKVVCELNADHGKEIFCRSDDVGEYLCCYIYLKSLDICTQRTLFIHVPSINEEYTPEATSSHVQKIIMSCLGQRLSMLAEKCN